MIKRKTSNWENLADVQGLLFFAQRMDEILFHYSMDTYKAPMLNIKLLLREYLSTIESISDGLLKDKNELPIFDEIVWILREDKIAQEIIGIRKSEEFLKNNGSYDKDTKRKVCQLFLSKLSGSQYLEAIEEQLRTAIISNRKKDIETYSKLFVRELTVIGYNSRYIFKCLNKVFYAKVVNSDASLDEFYGCFNLIKKEYSVYFSVYKELAHFSELLSKKLSENPIHVLEEDNIPRGIQKIEEYNVIEVRQISAFDEYSAYEMGKSVVELLNHFYSFYRCVGHDIYKNGFVKIENNVKLIKDSVSGIDKSKRTKSFDISSVGALNLFDLAMTNYENLYKLSRIMQIYNITLKIQSPSNALLNLWSILELLLEKEDNENDRSRIFNISDMVIPFLVNSYIERIVKNFLLDFKRWDEETATELLSKITVGKDEIEKIFAFLVLDEYETERKRIYALLESFPLLRFRIFSLNKQLGKKNEVNRIVKAHEQKVRWQLQRIYRARNCIIHDGDEVLNIEYLVENLFLYVDIVCERVLQRLSKNGTKYTVSDAIVEENLQMKYYDTSIENFKEINDENLFTFLYHGLEA